MFITFEGPDGCGKSTQVTLLVEHLQRAGYKIRATREPGGTSIGEQIREVVHDPRNKEMDPVAEVLLYSASRAQHVAQVIQPALAEGAIVVCDRFSDSTIAYQGYGHGLDLEMLRSITRFATRGLVPSLTFYLDIAPETGLRRRQQDTSAEWNRLDAQALSFHQRVHQGYLKMVEAEPERWFVLDGEMAPQAVHEAIWRHLLPQLEQRQRRLE